MRMWMALTQVACPLCASQHVVRFGINRQKKQRYQYRNTECSKDPFILVYAHKGYLPETKRAIVELTLNGSGIRDISRVLGISVKKRGASLQNINRSFLESKAHTVKSVLIKQVASVEIDEMWSFVKNKGHQRWLWHAIDHETGHVLAYVFGDRKDVVFKQLKRLLEPFGIQHYYTDDWGAYEQQLPEQQHTISKSNTQKIERKLLTLRTRI